MDDLLKNTGFRLSRITNWLIIISVIIFAMIYFSNLLKPLVLALVFWYLITELRNQLGRIKFGSKSIPRWLRTTLAFIILIIILFFTGNLIARNIEQIINKIPEYTEVQNYQLSDIGDKIGVPDLPDRIERGLGKLNIANFLTNILNSLTTALGNIVMIIIYIVFLLIEELIFKKKVKLISRSESQYKSILDITDQVEVAINKYISMQTLVSLLTAVLSYIVMIILGVEFAVLWAVIIFILNYIPYIGSLIATLLPSLFMVLQTGELISGIWVFLGVEVVQIVVGNYVQPQLMGKSLNLSPLVVVISLTLWGFIWGVLGMLLSVPIMSVLVIILAQFPSTRYLAILLSEGGDIDSFMLDDKK